MTADELKELIRTVPDFPRPGILFRDITSLIADGPGLAAAIHLLASHARAMGAEAIAGIEARGFIFGTGVAARLIARSDDLEALAAGVRKNLKILSGWRYEQFGRDAVNLVEGRLAFGIESGKLKMSRVVARETEDA